MSFKFAGTLYRNRREMHAAIAADWLSANGLNSRKEMLAILSTHTLDDIANEAAREWNLLENEQFDGDDLADALAEIRADFDAHFPEAE